MDRGAQLAYQVAQMTLQLERLSADGDWHALAALDRELAAWLPKLSSRQWTAAEHAALAQLRLAHGTARERCEKEAARVGTQLTQMRERKDGWMAYAMSRELEEERV